MRRVLYNEDSGFGRTKISAEISDEGLLIVGTVTGGLVGGRPADADWSVLVPRSCFAAVSAGLGDLNDTSPSSDDELLTALANTFRKSRKPFNELHHFLIGQDAVWHRRSYRATGSNESSTEYSSADVPRIGEQVYIPSNLYLSHGVDDYEGGLTTVTEVDIGRPHDGFVWIGVEFRESGSTRWDVLKASQEQLAQEFGTKAPKATPDYRAEFNKFDD